MQNNQGMGVLVLQAGSFLKLYSLTLRKLNVANLLNVLTAAVTFYPSLNKRGDVPSSAGMWLIPLLMLLSG